MNVLYDLWVVYITIHKKKVASVSEWTQLVWIEIIIKKKKTSVTFVNVLFVVHNLDDVTLTETK